MTRSHFLRLRGYWIASGMRPLFSCFLLFAMWIVAQLPSRATEFTFNGQAAAENPPRNATNWDDSANWSPVGIPGPGDTIIIDATQLPATVNLSHDATVSKVMVQGTLQGAGVLTATEGGEWHGGLISNVLTIPAGSTLTLRGGLNLSGTLNNDGNLIVIDGINVAAGAAIHNRGSIEARNLGATSSVFVSGSPVAGQPVPVFENTGTVLITGDPGGGLSISNVQLINAGTFEVRNGVLNLNAVDASMRGVLRADGGTFLDIGGLDANGSLLAFEPGNRIAGGGHVRLNGGIPLAFAGTVTIGGAEEGTLEFYGGDFRGNLALNVQQNGVALWSGGRLYGTLTVPSGNQLDVKANFALGSDAGGHGILDNAGTVHVDNTAAFDLGPGTEIRNSGTFEEDTAESASTSRSFIAGRSTPEDPRIPAFHNTGTFVQTAGNGSNVISDLQFDNSGTIDLQKGALYFAHVALTNAASVRLADATSMEWLGGTTVKLEGNSRFTGDGFLRITGDATVNGTVAIGPGKAVLELQSGALGGDTTLVADGEAQLRWIGSTLAGHLMIPEGQKLLAGIPNATLRLDGSAGAGVLENHGTVTLIPDASIYGSGGPANAILNSGLLEVQVSENLEAVRVQSNVGEGVVPFMVHNLPGGTLRTGAAHSSAVFIGTPIQNEGIVEVTQGTLRLDADYTQSETGQLRLSATGLSAPAETSRLTVGGAANLKGKLQLNLTSDFVPSLGDRYDVLSYVRHEGQFSQFGLGDLADLTLEPAYEDTQLRVGVISASQPGDVNGDRRVNILDAVLTLQSVVGSRILTAEEKSRADLNGDGLVNVRDATQILRKAVGL